MALPGSGQISISSSIAAASTQVAFETVQTGRAVSYSLARLSRGDYTYGARNISGSMYAGINQNSTNKPDRNTQHSLAEFFSYNHTQNGACSGTPFSDVVGSTTDNRYSYNRISSTGDVGNIVVISVDVPQFGGGPFSQNSAVYEIHLQYPFDQFGNLYRSPEYSGFANAISPARTDTYRHTMTASPQIFHIVCYGTTPIL